MIIALKPLPYFDPDWVKEANKKAKEAVETMQKRLKQLDEKFPPSSASPH